MSTSPRIIRESYVLDAQGFHALGQPTGCLLLDDQVDQVAPAPRPLLPDRFLARSSRRSLGGRGASPAQLLEQQHRASTNIKTAQSAYRANQMGQDQTYYSLNGHIDTPANSQYNLCIFHTVKTFYYWVYTLLASGTLTANFQIGTSPSALTSITGLSAIAVTNVLLDTEYTATDGTNTALPGYALAVTVSAGAAPSFFDFSLGYTRYLHS